MQTPNSDGPPEGVPPAKRGQTGEFATIERLRARFEAAARAAGHGIAVPPDGQTWIGDDAAVVGLGDDPTPLVLTTDLVVDGVHVDLERGTVGDAGYKALAATVSDLAAMGARPRYALVSVAAPPGTDLDALAEGLADAAADHGCAVVGGDLSRSRCLVVSVAALGDLGGKAVAAPLLRSGASPGDRVFVTGPLGASAAGMRLLAGTPGPPSRAPDRWDRSAEALVRAHLRPVARVDEGERARLAGASAAIDVSDGLAADAGRLASASGVGLALVDIPVAPGATTADAVGGGEDYELVITTATPDRLVAQFAEAGLRPPLPIGTATTDPDELTLDGRPLPASGWEHRF